MGRARSPDRDKALNIYVRHNGEIDLIDIAKELDLPPGTIRGWKNKDKWGQFLNGTFQKNTERSKNGKRKGAPFKNQNAKGNKGGSAPLKNKNAEKHGFFSKWLPEDTQEIIKEIDTMNPIDILWENIRIQCAAIIRAQNIMYVKDQLDKTIEKVSDQSGNIIGEKWEVQQAWDKQATFLQAQSRAMKTLEGMIKQYEEMFKSELVTEEQKARIAVLKTKVPNTNKEDMNKQIIALADLINNPAPERVIEDD